MPLTKHAFNFILVLLSLKTRRSSMDYGRSLTNFNIAE